MALRGALALAAGCAALALGACGDDDGGAEPTKSSAGPGTISLKVTADDGKGAKSEGTLDCSPSAQRASASLTKKMSAAELCDSARALRTLLTAKPPRDRFCTRIYGGPETARVTGTLDGIAVDRRLKRTDGCEIADYAKAARLLPAA